MLGGERERDRAIERGGGDGESDKRGGRRRKRSISSLLLVKMITFSPHTTAPPTTPHTRMQTHTNHKHTHTFIVLFIPGCDVSVVESQSHV